MDSTIHRLLISKISSLVFLCECTGHFVSDMVINPEDSFLLYGSFDKKSPFDLYGLIHVFVLCLQEILLELFKDFDVKTCKITPTQQNK